MEFKVEFSSRAAKDLKKLPVDAQRCILKESLAIESEPFQFKKKIKRIRGINFPCYRLRIEYKSDSYRLFYGIEGDVVYVLRVVSRKDADKTIERIRKLDFPAG